MVGRFRSVESDALVAGDVLDAGDAAFGRTVIADQILSAQEPTLAVADYIDANSDAFFFLKSDDFATEYEYRIVLAAGVAREDYAYLDYSDSLVGVVLGERVPEWQRPRAIEACSKLEAKLGRMIWDNGRPWVIPVR